MSKSANQKIAALRALIDHPATSDVERINAQARIEDIQNRVSAFRSKKGIGSSEDMMRRRISRKGIAGLKNRIRAKSDEKKTYDRWPFGWDGPVDALGPNDHECGRAADGAIILGWKCPSCGDHVSRVISARDVYKYKDDPDGVQMLIDGIVSASTNHLCSDCWERWELA